MYQFTSSINSGYITLTDIIYTLIEILKWNNPPSIFGTVKLSFLGISRWELDIGQPKE